MNFIGLLIGVWTANRYKMRKFHWFFTPDKNHPNMTIQEKFFYFFESRKQYKKTGEWHCFSNASNFANVLFAMTMVLAADCSVFFNKYHLGLYASHYLVIIRMIAFGFNTIVSGTDFYDHVMRKKGRRLGISFFITICILIMEWLMWFKHFRWEQFPDKIPLFFIAFWAVFFSIIG